MPRYKSLFFSKMFRLAKLLILNQRPLTQTTQPPSAGGSVSTVTQDFQKDWKAYYYGKDIAFGKLKIRMGFVNSK